MKLESIRRRVEEATQHTTNAETEVETLEALVLTCWRAEGPYRSGGLDESESVRLHVEAARLGAWIAWRSARVDELRRELEVELDDEPASIIERRLLHAAASELLRLGEMMRPLSERARAAETKVRVRVRAVTRRALKREKERWPPDACPLRTNGLDAHRTNSMARLLAALPLRDDLRPPRWMSMSFGAIAGAWLVFAVFFRVVAAEPPPASERSTASAFDTAEPVRPPRLPTIPDCVWKYEADATWSSCAWEGCSPPEPGDCVDRYYARLSDALGATCHDNWLENELGLNFDPAGRPGVTETCLRDRMDSPHTDTSTRLQLWLRYRGVVETATERAKQIERKGAAARERRAAEEESPR